MISSRELALKILNKIENDNAYSNIELNKKLNKYIIPKNEKAFTTELVYGVIKWKLKIDWIIRQFSKIRLKKISPWILNALRIAIYQIEFLDKVPVSAAVNESVNLAKKYGNVGSSKFVNGLLRNYSRNIQNIEYPKKDEPIKYLSIMYSHPEWMVKRWINKFGVDFTQNLLETNNEKPMVNIRVNTLKCNKNELKEKLNNEDVQVENGLYFENCLIIKSNRSISHLESFKHGLFQIQDESSMMVGQILNPKAGQIVIDVCAAPGGKTTHIAQLMNNEGIIHSRDIHEHKIKLIEKNANRLGIDIITANIYDATKLDSNLIDKADYVLADVPCSGFGIIKRKPDIKWNKNLEQNKNIISIQKNILSTSSKYLKIGGTLVYSTCTIEQEENLDVVNKFLNNNKNFELVDISNCLPEKLQNESCSKGYIQTYPNVHKIDGFFVAKMKRIS